MIYIIRRFDNNIILQITYYIIYYRGYYFYYYYRIIVMQTEVILPCFLYPVLGARREKEKRTGERVRVDGK